MVLVENIQGEVDFYPPRTEPPQSPLGAFGFVKAWTTNPITALPEDIFTQGWFRQQLPWGNILFVSDPEIVKTIFLDEAQDFSKTQLERRVLCPMLGDGPLTAEGETWRQQRKAAAPYFRHSELLAYVPTVSSLAERLSAEWTGHDAATAREVDRDMMEITFGVITETVFSLGDSFDARKIRKWTQDYLAAAPAAMAAAALNLPKWMPYPGSRQAAQSAKDLRALVARKIDERAASPETQGNDLLSKLLADTEIRCPVSKKRLLDQLVTFLLAGHDTTANTLTWTLYLLARSPEWQQKVREEVRSVAPSGPLKAEHIEQLPVTLQVIKEAMRLYPPAPIMSRTALHDHEVDGLKIRKGDLIFVPVYAIHRHKKLWGQPDQFDPRRFDPGKEDTRPRFAFMPFGAGSRICIGQSFALIEASVILATLMRDHAISVPDGFEPNPMAQITLHADGGMPLNLHKYH